MYGCMDSVYMGQKMKIRIFEDERYPTIFISRRDDDDFGKIVEIDEDTYNEVVEAERKYDATQAILKYLYSKGEK